MKKLFYAVAVVAAIVVCSCANKAQNANAGIVEGEAIEIVDGSCCDKGQTCCEEGKECCDSCCQDKKAE